MPSLRVLQEMLAEYFLHGLHKLIIRPRKTLTKNKHKNKNKRIKQKQQQTASKTLSQNLEPFSHLFFALSP